MDKLSAQKLKIIFLRYQRLLRHKKWEYKNQCGITVIANTIDHGSIPLW